MATATDILTKLKAVLDSELEGVEVTEWPAGSQNPPCLYSVQIGEYKIDVRPDTTIIWGPTGEELAQNTKDHESLKAAIEGRIAKIVPPETTPETKISSLDDLHEKMTALEAK